MLELGLFLLGVVTASWVNLLLQRTRRPVQIYGDDSLAIAQATPAETLRQYERVVSCTPDGIALVDRTYTYRLVNQAYLSRTQKQQEHVIGHTVSEVLGETFFHTVVKPQFDQCLAGKPIHYGNWLDFPNGQRQFIDVTYAPYIDLNGNISGVVVNTRDLTNLKQAETALCQQTLQEKAFSRIVQTMRNSLDLDTIFATAVQEFAKLLHLDIAGITQYVPEQQYWDCIAEHIRSPGICSILGTKIPDQDNPIVAQLKLGEIVVTQDTRMLDDAFNLGLAARISSSPIGWLSFPLEVDGKIWGSVGGAKSSVPISFTEDDIHLAGRFADQLAISIQQANLYQQVQQLNQVLKQQVQDRTDQLKLALSAAKMGAWEWDMLTNQQSWSPENYQLWGCCTDSSGRVLDQAGVELSPFPTFELVCSRVHPDDRDYVLQTIQQTSKQRQPYEIEHRICWDDGSIHWRYSRGAYVFNEQGQPIKLTGISMDITDRKAAETALKISEQNLRTIFNNVSSHVLVHDVDGSLLDVNDRVLEFQGLDREQVMQLSLLEDCSAPDAPFHLAHEYWQRALLGETVHFEWKSKRPSDGLLFESEITLSRIIWDGKVVILANVQDVSDRKRAEADLKASETRFRTLVEELQVAVVVFNADMHPILFNSKSLELVGVTLDEIENSDLFDPNWRVIREDGSPLPPVEYPIVRATTTRQPVLDAVLGVYQPNTQDPVWLLVTAMPQLDGSGEISQVICTATDISDRKRAEAALRQSEARFQHLTANIPGVFYQSLIHADGSRQFHYVSSGFQRVFELESAQILADANTFWAVVHPDDVNPLQAEITRTLMTREPFQFEYRITTPSGRTKWIHNAASREYLANGDIVSDGVVLDITERKQAELEVRRNRDLFEAMFQEATDAIILSDPISRRILDCNQRAVELFEANRKAELVGIEGHRLRKTPWSAIELVEVKQALENQQVLKQECEYCTYKGHYFWGSVALKSIQIAGQQMILVRITDISDRKHIEFTLQRQSRADQLLATITQTINQSIQISEVLEICLEQIRQFLECDRVIVCSFDPNYDVVIELEAVSQPHLSLVGRTITDPCFDQGWAERYRQGYITVRADTHTEEIAPCYADFLAEMQIRANLVVAILQADQIWGLLIAHHCTAPRAWQPFEVDLFKQLGLQIGIANQKNSLYHQLEDELKVRRCTEHALAQQVQREQLLRTLSQQIRQSLRLDEILATTVKEVRQLLKADRAVIFRLNRDRSGVVIQEALLDDYPTTAEMYLIDQHFPQESYDFYLQGQARTVHRTDIDGPADCLVAFMEQIGVKSKIVAPILQTLEDTTPTVWGLLIVHACADYRQWQSVEVDLLQQLATQVGIAIQQAGLYSRIEDQLAQKEVLLKEVHHRVKNNLQVISSMLWLQTEATNHPAVSRALEDTRNRLQAMALIHETLYQHGDLGQINFHTYIRRLANNILAVYSPRPDRIQVHFHLQSVVFNLETAMPCGLLLNELITNAIKHGFPDDRQGEIRIILETAVPPEPQPSYATQPASQNLLSAPKNSAQASSDYCLTVQDNGIGIPETLNLKQLKSLGLKIAYDLALQLEGTLELDRTQGTRFCLTFSALEYGKRF